MKFKYLLKTMFICLAFIASPTFAQEWVQIADFPDMNTISSMIETPDGALYASTRYDNYPVLKSIDQGAIWVQTGVLTESTAVRELVAASSNLIYAVARCNNGTEDRGCLFRTTDGGDNWIEIWSPENAAGISTLLLTADGTLLAGGWDDNSTSGVIYKSIDSGDTWNQKVLPAGMISVFALLEDSDGTLYAGGRLESTDDNTAGILRSPDQGDNWFLAPQPGSASTVMCLLEASDGRIYAGTSNDLDVYVSDNGGDSWTNTAEIYNGSWGVVNTLVEASDGTIYAGVNRGETIYYTTNGGASWIEPPNGPYEANSVNSILETSAGDILLGVRMGDINFDEAAIFRKCDGCNLGNVCYEDGQVNPVNSCQYCNLSESSFNWTEDSEAGCLSWEPTNELPVMSCAMDMLEPEPGEILVAGVCGSPCWQGYGCIFRTENFGGSWVMVNNRNYHKRYDHIFKAIDGALYASGNSGTYDPFYPYEFYGSINASYDGGETWECGGSFHDTYYAYDSMQTRDGRFFVGTYNEARVYTSGTGGTHWEETGPLTDAFGVYSILEGDDGSIYAGTSSEGDVYKTINGGATWEKTGELEGAWKVELLLYDNDGAILAGANDGQIFRTTNNGQTWELISRIDGMGIIRTIAITPEGVLWVGTNEENVHGDLGAVFFSEDFGETWQGTYRLGESESVNKLLLASDGNIYASTSEDGRVYRAYPGDDDDDDTGDDDTGDDDTGDDDDDDTGPDDDDDTSPDDDDDNDTSADDDDDAEGSDSNSDDREDEWCGG